jgi:hypothetical protein
MSLPTDNLLSAFHDGEIAPAERAAAEQRLATSTDARREMSEYQQISSLLNELPRNRLPSEFPQQVLQAIEREMLIPSRPIDSMAPERSPSPRRWIGAAAVLTSAAGLLLLVRALDDRAGHDLAKGHRVAGTQNAPAAPVDVVADSALPMVAENSVTLGGKNDLAAGAAGQNGLFANAPANTVTRSRIASGAAGDKFVLDQTSLRTADVGEVVRAIQQTEGDEVAVVFLTVVDRQEGLDGLQFLLAKNRFTRSEDEAKAKSDRDAPSAKRADEMQAVLVQSDVAQLATALKQLGQEKYLQSLEVDQPILLAELNEARGDRLLQADKAISADARREYAKSSPDSATSTRRAKSALPETLEKKSGTVPLTAAKTNEARDEKEPSANQVRLGVSAQMLQQNQLAQQSRTRGLSKEALRNQTLTAKEAEAAADHRPLQVLFVVVDQSQSAKPQTLPAAPSKPAAAPAKSRQEPVPHKGQDGAA